MQTATDAIAQSLKNSQALIHRYADDLAPAEFLHRTSPKANCAAWVIGHLALTDRKALAHLGVTDLPTLPAGFEQRFGRDESSAMASDFGDTTALLPVFDQHRNALVVLRGDLEARVVHVPLEIEEQVASFGPFAEADLDRDLPCAGHADEYVVLLRF